MKLQIQILLKTNKNYICHKWFFGGKMSFIDNLTLIWLTSTISKTSNPTFILSFSVEEGFLGTNSFLYFSLSSLIKSHSCSSLPSSQLNSWLHFSSIEIHLPFQQVNCLVVSHWKEQDLMSNLTKSKTKTEVFRRDYL